MDWTANIQRAVDYIEENLTNPLDYAEIARNACVSVFHFQRVFHILSGVTIDEYIRSRRLALAAAELKGSDVKVIDLAMKYGYESPESFSRAFERFHGALPSRAREAGVNVKAFPRLSVKVILKGGCAMDYRIEEKAALRLLCRKDWNDIKNVRIPAFWEECGQDGTIKYLSGVSAAEDKAMIGFIDGSSFNGSGYHYYIGTPYIGEEIPDGCAVYEIPPHLWAIFRCARLSDEAVNADIFQRIYSEFFPGSDYEPSKEPFQCEVFPEGSGGEGIAVDEVWISVAKKSAS